MDQLCQMMKHSALESIIWDYLFPLYLHITIVITSLTCNYILTSNFFDIKK